ncbi:MAG: TonB-dependent receptor [Candidatus Symbiothrix sp.]|jgi:TonB-linked SusC/RagA family outer membrane protein|nr:TonB-dependent receptor [Candidatus Symbiothrix sp.]
MKLKKVFIELIKRRVTLLLLLLVIVPCFAYSQQSSPISGVVSDASGEPLTGVSVVIKQSTVGTVTDIDGKYSIQAKPDAVLVFSYIGYAGQEIPVGNRTTIDVTLKENDALLDEVVVVGYGVQKKVNLTGSVSTVSAEQIANRPGTSLGTALAGIAPGVNVLQGRGKPGDEAVSFNFRGQGSFNNSSPLILVDGFETDMMSINSDDVESISFLKDASASAIYGSRAANGVILVTTKKGSKGVPTVTFSAMYSRIKPVTELTLMSSTADFMELHNIAKVNANPTATSPDYSYETISDWRAANANPNGMYTNPVTGQQIPNWLAYPNTDWAQYLFQPDEFHRYGVSVSGSTPASKYLLSLAYLNNPGTLDNTALQRFNVRANVESKIADFITFGTQTYATKNFTEPGNTSFTYLLQGFPGITPVYQGKYGASEDPNTTQKDNILQQVVAVGGLYKSMSVVSNWYTNIELPLEGLVGEAKFNYSEYKDDNETYSQDIPRYSFRESFDTPKEGIGNLEQATSSRNAYTSSRYTADLILRYAHTFDKHDVGALFGYEQSRTEYGGFSATKKGLLDWSITDITSGATMESIGGTAKNVYAMLSYFGRVNYAYDSRYLFEASFRSDQSSKFAPDHRGNFFPSAAIGWRASEESFFEPVLPYVNYLKLRFSYGSLGNTVGGNYDWQALYQKVNHVFNEQVSNGIIQQTLQNLNLSWEKLSTIDFGLEASFLRQRLTTELDFYSRKTSDILTAAIIYKTMGSISAPMSNTASMDNKGIELTVGWKDQVGDFKYSVSAIGGYNINEVTGFKGKLKYEQDSNTLDIWGNPTWRYTNLADVSTGGDTRRVEGHLINEYFLRRPYQGSGLYNNADGSINPNGGPKDGMIRTKADLEWVKSMIAAGYSFNNNTVGSGAANIWYGQVIMADVNGDGKYGNDDDREFTGKSNMPKFTFGLSMNAEWKGFDLSAIWSGQLGSYHYFNERGSNGSIISNVGDQIPGDSWNMFYFYDAVKAYTDYDNYDPANDPDARINARYPRLLTGSSIMTSSTFYLYNTSFLKLRTLQVGYTLPKKWLTPAKIGSLRVFVSGDNLLTIKHSDFPGVDPELGGGLSIYPISKYYTAGVSLTF